MAIIKSKTFENGYKMQLVSGKHIRESYLNNKYIKSCMSTPKKSERMAFYVACGTKLLRVLDPEGNLVLRTLVWTAVDPDGTKVVTLDRVYRRDRIFNYVTGIVTEIPSYTLFLKHWKEFADVRESAKLLRVKVKNYKLNKWPYADTFRFANKDVTEVSNKSTPTTKWVLNRVNGSKQDYSNWQWQNRW